MFRFSWMVIQAVFFLGILVGLILALSVLFGVYVDSVDKYARAGDIRIVGASAPIDNDRMNARRIAGYMDIESAGGAARPGAGSRHSELRCPLYTTQRTGFGRDSDTRV